MTAITVKSDGADSWNVVAENGQVLAEGLSNRAAWRQADILSKEHLNQSQAKSDWIADKIAGSQLRIPRPKKRKGGE